MEVRLTGKEALEQLNAERAVIQLKGKVRIFGWEPAEGRPGQMPVFSTPPEMKTLYANQFLLVNEPTPDGGTRQVRRPLFDYWLKHAERPSAKGITLDPTGGRFVGEQLNLWQGYGVEPDEFSNWSLLKQHISEVICAGNEEHADYLQRWIAWSLQNPTKPAEVVVVLRGRKGTGKSLLGRVLCKLFGAHAMQISDRKHLVGSFNAHLLQVCFLFADEAFWPGDKSAEGPLKRMITEPTLFVEPKGIDAFEVPNRLTIMMASNEKWVVPATTDERRYVVFDVSDAHRQDHEYFAALMKQLDENGGLEDFLGDMLKMDLKSWHPRQDLPVTQGLADQQAESAEPMIAWLGGLLDDGALPYAMRDSSGRSSRIVHRNDPALARPRLLWEHARGREKRLQHSSEVAFWKFLDEHGVTKDNKSRDAHGRFRRFPPLQQARQMFRDKYPWWPEFDDIDAHWHFEEVDLRDRGDWEGIPGDEL